MNAPAVGRNLLITTGAELRLFVSGVKDIRELADRVRANGAVFGTFVTLQPPTKNMLIEAAEAGVYESPTIFQSIPTIQILTVEQMLAGERPIYPVALNRTLTQIRGMLPPDPKQVVPADEPIHDQMRLLHSEEPLRGGSTVRPCAVRRAATPATCGVAIDVPA